MKNKFTDLGKKIKKGINPKILEKFLLRIIWLFAFYMIFQVGKNFYYLQKIKPNMSEIDITLLAFFFDVHNINILILVVSIGFLLMYYHNRRKKEVK